MPKLAITDFAAGLKAYGKFVSLMYGFAIAEDRQNFLLRVIQHLAAKSVRDFERAVDYAMEPYTPSRKPSSPGADTEAK